MKIRFSSNPDELQQFLVENDYPYEWPLEALKQCLLIAVKSDEDETVGYVWYSWTEIPNMLEFHICIRKDWQRKWLTRQVVVDLHRLGEFLGATSAICMTPLPRMQRAMALLGWKLAGPFAYTSLPNKWCHNVHAIPEDLAPASGRSSGSSSSAS